MACFTQLRTDWRSRGLRTKKMEGRKAPNGETIYEARVTRGDRVTFFFDDGRIVIENHCHHDILRRGRR